ncbi:MAG: ferritin-like domain-containing protein [Actinomycetota bacterium]|nr:ferritin-like domain-containing protein [Actinomycetota bacterium]
MTRESFLLRSTLAGAAAYGTLSATGLITKALAESGGGDVDILNFALTLEYLETEFYVLAAKQVKGLSDYESKLTKELRDNESEHVDALAATIKKLGGKAVAKPEFDFGGAFGNRATYLKTANTLEDTGVSAYNGAAPMIKSAEVLGAAGSIVQVEGRHASLIRLVRNKPPAPEAFDKASDMDAVLSAVKPFIKA